MVQWSVMLPHSKKVQSSQVLSVQSLQVLSISALVVWMQFRIIGHSRLLIGLNVSVNGCLSLYVSPMMTW